MSNGAAEGGLPGYILLKRRKEIQTRELSFWKELHFNYLQMIIELLAVNANESIPVFQSF